MPNEFHKKTGKELKNINVATTKAGINSKAFIYHQQIIVIL